MSRLSENLTILGGTAQKVWKILGGNIHIVHYQKHHKTRT